MSYIFDESQLADDGECKVNAISELWIIDAKNMRDVIGRIQLPQRVPYGLHGNWFSKDNVDNQRPIDIIRALARQDAKLGIPSRAWHTWTQIRRELEELLG